MRQVVRFDFQNTEIPPVAARAAQRAWVNDPRPPDPFVADAVRVRLANLRVQCKPTGFQRLLFGDRRAHV